MTWKDWLGIAIPVLIVVGAFVVSMVETRADVKGIQASVDRIEARVFVLATESNCNEE